VESAASNRVNESVCPVGHYCVNGVRLPCPAGRYGDSPGLSSASCSGVCVAGYYCPVASNSSKQVQCGGAHLYCLEVRELLLAVHDGLLLACFAHLASLGDACGCVSQGSVEPMTAPPGEYTSGVTELTASRSDSCPPGSYCIGGVRRQCPGGVFGCSPRLSTPSCSGNCSAGFYCQPGSLSLTETACGSGLGAVASVFCVAGSSRPESVTRGHYSVSSSTSDRGALQRECEEGYFCVDGVKVRMTVGYVSLRCCASLRRYCP
jgi:hypothetical protein